MWGKNFLFQYDGSLRTVDQVRTSFGGSEAVPKTPGQIDPRSVVAQSKLEADPRPKNHCGLACFCQRLSRRTRLTPPGARPSGDHQFFAFALIDKTGQQARAMTLAVTLPSMTCSIPVRPWVDMTIRSVFSSSAFVTILL